jgi:hypothetical protein
MDRARRGFVLAAPILVTLALASCKRSEDLQRLQRATLAPSPPPVAAVHPVRIDELPRDDSNEIHSRLIPKTRTRASDTSGRPVSVEDLAVAAPVAGRALRQDELTPGVLRAADDVLWRYDAPLGTEVEVEVEGKTFLARFEQHYHEEGGPQRPWGWHKGLTFYTTE